MNNPSFSSIQGLLAGLKNQSEIDASPQRTISSESTKDSVGNLKSSPKSDDMQFFLSKKYPPYQKKTIEFLKNTL